MSRVASLREKSNRLYGKAAENFTVFALLLLAFIATVSALVYNGEGGKFLILISVALATIVMSVVFLVFFIISTQKYNKVARELFQEEIVESLDQNVNGKQRAEFRSFCSQTFVLSEY